MTWIGLYRWRVAGDGPAHAFRTRDGLPYRSACDLSLWRSDARAAESGPLCQPCRQLVTSLAFAELEQVHELESRAGVPPSDPAWEENMLREAWGR